MKENNPLERKGGLPWIQKCLVHTGGPRFADSNTANNMGKMII